MCCNRINTDTLMANLFVASYKQKHVDSTSKIMFSVEQLREYLQFLSDQFPVYVASNFSKEAVSECAHKYPLYYQLAEQDGELFVSSGKEHPNLDFFNAIFSQSVSTYINRITDIYLSEMKH